MGLIFDDTIPMADIPVGCVNSHFFDSGSFTLRKKAERYGATRRCPPWRYYQKQDGSFTKRFQRYLDAYAVFVKKYAVAIDLYANVDIIGHPELTWKSQRYLECEHDLSPVPVVHYKTHVRWLCHYLDNGYDIIGLGGLVGSTKQQECRKWLDCCFDVICNTRDRKPCVRVHGFGVTSYELLRRYPWYSVDSTSWTKLAAFGSIYVPPKRKGEFVFTQEPYIVKVSDEADIRTPVEKRIIQEWLDFIGIPMGKVKDGTIVEYGVVTRHTERRTANLLFFEHMRKALPAWPWSWRQ